MTRRILHPSDFSTASQAAFKKAVELAKASRAELARAMLEPAPLDPETLSAMFQRPR